MAIETDKTIFVEREQITKNDKTFFTYYIKGNVRGKDVKVAIVPPDFGGYAVLDIVYNGESKAELTLKPYEIKDDKTGKVVKGNSYGVISTDADGKVYECQIKPFRSSDKTLLNMLLR